MSACPWCGSTSMLYSDPLICANCGLTVPSPSIEKQTTAAGPRLDRLVAEKVMGWERCGEDGWYDAAHHYDAGACRLTNPPEKQIPEQKFEPSTNIAHAMEVVTAMRRTKHAWFSLNWYGDDASWHAGFGDGARSTPGVGADPATAICLAALAALDK